MTFYKLKTLYFAIFWFVQVKVTMALLFVV